MEFTLIPSVGDGLAATPLFRELKKLMPEENLRVFEAGRPELFLNNRNLNRGNRDNGIRLRLGVTVDEGRLCEQYVAQARAALNLPELRVDDDTPELFLTDAERAESFGVEPGDRSVAINADASWNTRRWPYFRELAERLLARGWAVYHVGADQTPALPCTRSFHNKLTLRQTAALLTRVSRVVCNDTGLMHVAAAMGTPCVVTFGYINAARRAYATTRVPGGERRCDPRCLYTRCRASERCAQLDLLAVNEVFAEVVR